jgi:hypothetical protein
MVDHMRTEGRIRERFVLPPLVVFVLGDLAMRLTRVQLTIRRLMTALAVFAVGLAGATSPNAIVAFVSVETLLVSLPLALSWRLLPPCDRIAAVCFWLPITLSVSMLITLCLQAYLHITV